MNEQLEEKIRTLERVTGWVTNIDAKSSIMMAFVGVFMSMLFTSGFILNALQVMIKPFTNYVNTGNGVFDLFITIKLTTFCLFVVCIVRSLLYLIKTVAAKTSSKQTGETDVLTDSLIHFGSIQEKTYSQFKTAVQSEADSEKMEDVLSQIYINSKRCQEKSNDYNSAIKLLRISVLLFLMFMILIVL